MPTETTYTSITARSTQFWDTSRFDDRDTRALHVDAEWGGIYVTPVTRRRSGRRPMEEDQRRSKHSDQTHDIRDGSNLGRGRPWGKILSRKKIINW